MESKEFGLRAQDALPATAHWVTKMVQRIARDVGASVDIAADKAYASYFLRSLGYHAPKEQTFFSPKCCERIGNDRGVDDACRFAEELGFPVIVKPNNLSQGTLVIKAHTAEEIRQAAKHIFQKTDVLLVQQFVEGKDYRVVVLDDDIISAYERIALHVTGDGKKSIRQLLEELQAKFECQKRDTIIDSEDFRITNKLAQQ